MNEDVQESVETVVVECNSSDCQSYNAGKCSRPQISINEDFECEMFESIEDDDSTED